MSATTHDFGVDKLGVASDPFEFEVDRDKIVAYAEATNDEIAQHAKGEYASPVFAIVPAFGALMGSSAGVIPGELIMRVLHGEQDFRYHGVVKPDTTLVTEVTPVGIHTRSSGVTVTSKAETRDKDSGELLVEQYLTAFVRGADAEVHEGEEPPAHSLDATVKESEPLAEVAQTFDADQTFRYSEASGDPMPIHLDEDIAKAAGLPGIIIHGLCTMAFASRAVIETVCPEDPSRLKRLAVRFSKIVQPGQTITTRIWETGEGTYAFETVSEDGKVVITDGLAEVA
jgi:acyl dehydratase